MSFITIEKKRIENCIYYIKPYSFIINDNDVKQNVLPNYIIKINKSFNPINLHALLDEISGGIDFKIKTLTEVPEKVTTLIENYEENYINKNICLFHDLRTKYVDIIDCETSYDKNNVILVGFTSLQKETIFVLKAFSAKVLSFYIDAFVKYFNNKNITCYHDNNIDWIRLQNLVKTEPYYPQNDLFKNFLEATLDERFNSTFLDILKIIDFTGFIPNVYLDKEINISGRTTSIRKITQITRYFTQFWRTEIQIQNKTCSVISLHDEVDCDHLDNLVYTFKPQLLCYYKNHWFEDFCYKLISRLKNQDFSIIHHSKGQVYNFFQNEISNDDREIDIVVGVSFNGAFKIVAIECKKTLSKDEIKKTKKKIQDKILKSNNFDIIDAHIFIGCYNKDVDFDKSIAGNAAYKQSIINSNDNKKADVPYYAFSMTSIADFKNKFCYIIKDILKNW